MTHTSPKALSLHSKTVSTLALLSRLLSLSLLPNNKPFSFRVALSFSLPLSPYLCAHVFSLYPFSSFYHPTPIKRPTSLHVTIVFFVPLLCPIYIYIYAQTASSPVLSPRVSDSHRNHKPISPRHDTYRSLPSLLFALRFV